MTRYHFADVVFEQRGNNWGWPLPSERTFTAWDSPTGSQLTNLALDAAGTMPITSVTADSQGNVDFYGPDGVSSLYLRASNGNFVLFSARLTSSNLTATLDPVYAKGGALVNNLPAGVVDGQTALCSGRFASGDGGAGSFVWTERNGKTHDGATVIVPSGYAGTKGWLRVEALSGTIRPQWWTYVADGNSNPLSAKFTTLTDAQNAYPSLTGLALTDEQGWAALQSAFNAVQTWGKVLIPAHASGGDIRLNKTLTLFDKAWVSVEGESMVILRQATEGVAILRMGGTSEKVQNLRNLYLYRPTVSTNPGSSGISVCNLNHSSWRDVWIWNCYNGIFQDGATDNISGRNVFFSNHITGLRVRSWSNWAMYLKSGSSVESTQNFFYDAYFSQGQGTYSATDAHTLPTTSVAGCVLANNTDLVFLGANFEHTFASVAMLRAESCRVELHKTHIEFVDVYLYDDLSNDGAALFAMISGAAIRATMVEQEYTALQKTVSSKAATKRYLTYFFNGGSFEAELLHTNGLRTQTSTDATWTEVGNAGAGITLKLQRVGGTGTAVCKVHRRLKGSAITTGSHYTVAYDGTDPAGNLEQVTWGASIKPVALPTSNPGAGFLWNNGGVVTVGT